MPRSAPGDDGLVQRARLGHLDHERRLARVQAGAGERQRIGRGGDHVSPNARAIVDAALPRRRAQRVLLAAAIHESEGHAGLADRVQVDGAVALLDDLRPQHVGDALRHAAFRVAPPQLVQVAGERDAFAGSVVRRHARGELMRQEIGDRHRDHRALEPRRIDLGTQARCSISTA